MATLDRPALQGLLSDVGAGKIDDVVVYKVDRRTRSLADFAKLVNSSIPNLAGLNGRFCRSRRQRNSVSCWG
jgi:DNA invertase Pin-like site-specific DNA recombinase